MTHVYIPIARLSCALLTTLAIGCYASHEIEGFTLDPPLDPPTVPVPEDPPSDDPSCPSAPEGHITIEYRDVPPAPSTGSCLRPDGVLYGTFWGAEPAEAVDGVTLHLDACADGLVECPCDITIGGVGTELASSIGSAWEGLTVSGELGDQSVSLWIEEACARCATCGCPPARILVHAEDAIVGSVRWPRGLDISAGEPSCSVSTADGCATSELAVTATTDWVDPDGHGEASLTVDVGQVESTVLDTYSMSLQTVRSSITSCPDIRVAWAPAWIAWHTPFLMPVEERTGLAP
jgi:hypothetical protein